MKFPKIGSEVEGGLFAGIVAGEAEDCALILLHHMGVFNWQDAMDWAASINGSLPTCSEQAVLYGNLKKEFKPRWHWSSEQDADSDSYAWLHYFSDGYQNIGHKLNEYRARAVRRIPLSEFLKGCK